MPEMKSLNGAEIAEFIKERQAKQVRSLRQADGVQSKLAIVVTVENPVIDVYMRMKQRYGADILIDVDIHRVKQAAVLDTIADLNSDPGVHGIIVQLPLEDPTQTDEVVDAVAPEKDVDGLGKDAVLDSATPMAILWLLSAYNVELRGKQVLLIGRGKLVGASLEKMLVSSGVSVFAADSSTSDLTERALAADVIITATGSPGVLTSDMVKSGAVVVDAGTASESGKTVGDIAADLYDRDDISITPKRGGVGPLTVCALFDNVIRAARLSVGKEV